VIVFRHADPRFPFLWETSAQPPGRWHGEGEGPVGYFADTADAAWAEFLRHEEIRDAQDLPGVRRALWAIEIGEPPDARPRLIPAVTTGPPATYQECRAEARRLRENGATGLVAPCAAVKDDTPSGFRTEGGLRAARRRRERSVVLFGHRPDLVGWAACAEGRPRDDLLARVRHFAET
jgi:RES domain